MFLRVDTEEEEPPVFSFFSDLLIYIEAEITETTHASSSSMIAMKYYTLAIAITFSIYAWLNCKNYIN